MNFSIATSSASNPDFDFADNLVTPRNAKHLDQPLGLSATIPTYEKFDKNIRVKESSCDEMDLAHARLFETGKQEFQSTTQDEKQSD